MKNFKLFGGQELENLGEYILEYYAKYPDIKFYVGTDSAQYGKVTKYATALAMLHPGKGVHVVFKRTSVRRERDMFTRLWNEVEFTREVADYVHEILKDVYKHKDGEKIPTIHLDFNKSPKHKSNIVHDLSVGYIKSFGYKVETKSSSWCATFCADTFVKN
jgi:predicted RNase H-related nuclease YkuK (DUF458 family)